MPWSLSNLRSPAAFAHYQRYAQTAAFIFSNSKAQAVPGYAYCFSVLFTNNTQSSSCYLSLTATKDSLRLLFDFHSIKRISSITFSYLINDIRRTHKCTWEICIQDFRRSLRSKHDDHPKCRFDSRTRCLSIISFRNKLQKLSSGLSQSTEYCGTNIWPMPSPEPTFSDTYHTTSEVFLPS